jgi:hypothetical protein
MIRTSPKMLTVLSRVNSLGWACILGFVLSAASSAFGAAQIKIGEGAADNGGTGFVPVTLTSDSPAVALQFDLLYDAALVTAVTPVLKDPSAKHTVSASFPREGVQRILVYSLLNTPLTNGNVINLQFSPKPSSAGRSVSLIASNAIVASAAGTRITPVDLVSGKFSTSADTGSKFTSITLLTTGPVEIVLKAAEGRVFAFQSSPNLRDWTAFTTNTVPAGGLLKINAAAASQTGNRFYRAASQ